MKPFDDMIPEEMEPDSKELLSLLQRTTRGSASIPPIEQEKIVAKVRERLLLSSSNTMEKDVPVQQLEMVEPTSQRQSIKRLAAGGEYFTF